MKNSGLLALALSVFLGFTSLGYFFNKALVDTKAMERTVVVKGLAEESVMANKVLWPIQFKVSANSLEELSNKSTLYRETIKNFLLNQGITSDEIIVTQPSVEDRNLYASQGNAPTFAYSSTNLVTVSSEKVELVSRLTFAISELLQQNVPLSGSDGYSNNVQYSFTKLNELKPSMIEKATKNARDVAEKFAKDSSSFLGKIKKASQGQFSITTQDKFQPQYKTVRVVSTVEYYLVD